MSLINDALKRATNAQTTSGPSTGAPMRAADGRQSTGLPRYFVPVLLCIFCGAFWFIVRGWDARRQADFYPQPVKLHARESTAAAADTSQGAAPYGAITQNRQFGLNDESTAITSTPAAASAPASAVSSPEPEYRLQGIFYRPAAPSAVINAKTVYVGDWISGAQVKAIDRQSVTLERAGQTQILTLQ